MAKELEQTQFGILCLTPENLTAPWLLFEAGALSKVVAETNVCPLLLGINKQTDITGPLAQFQSVKADKEGIWNLVKAVNHALGNQALDEKNIEKVFNALWSDFESSIKAISEIPQEPVSLKRTQEDLLEEVLKTIREQSRLFSDFLETQSRLFLPLEFKERQIYINEPVLPIPKIVKHSGIKFDDVQYVKDMLTKNGPLSFAELKSSSGFSEHRFADVVGYMVRKGLILKGEDKRYKPF